MRSARGLVGAGGQFVADADRFAHRKRLWQIATESSLPSMAAQRCDCYERVRPASSSFCNSGLQPLRPRTSAWLFDDIVLLGGVGFEVEELVFGHRGVGQLLFDDDVAGGFFRVPLQFPFSGTVAVVSGPAVVLLDQMRSAPWASGLPSRASRTSKLSRQAFSGSAVFVRVEKLPARSMVHTTSSLSPAGMRPFQRVMNGVRVPPS